MQNHILEKRSSSGKSHNFKKTDSIDSIASSNGESALDFLADMCVGIDEIGTSMNGSPLTTSTREKKNSLTDAFDEIQGRKSDSDINFPNREKKNSLTDAFDEIQGRKSDSDINIFSRDKKSNSFGEVFDDLGGRRSDIDILGSTTPKLGGSDLFYTLNNFLPLIKNENTTYINHIPMKLIQTGPNNIHLVPLHESDIQYLIQISHLEPPQNNIGISIVSGRSSLTSVTSEKSTSSNANNSTNKSTEPSKVINPKHIYKTSCDTYRVQMSKGSKTNPNCKFSRNARSELDAYWLCEYALILNDRPSSIYDLLYNGNYKCMLQRSIVADEEDFLNQLHMHFYDMERRSLLKPNECETIHAFFDTILTSDKCSSYLNTIRSLSLPTGPMSRTAPYVSVSLDPKAMEDLINVQQRHREMEVNNSVHHTKMSVAAHTDTSHSFAAPNGAQFVNKSRSNQNNNFMAYGPAGSNTMNPMTANHLNNIMHPGFKNVSHLDTADPRMAMGNSNTGAYTYEDIIAPSVHHETKQRLSGGNAPLNTQVVIDKKKRRRGGSNGSGSNASGSGSGHTLSELTARYVLAKQNSRSQIGDNLLREGSSPQQLSSADIEEQNNFFNENVDKVHYI